MNRILLLSSLLTWAALASCGSSIGQVQTYNCCPKNHKLFYSCPDQASFAKCKNDGDASECTRDPALDIGCPAIWPSGP